MTKKLLCGCSRRRFLTGMTSALGALGVGMASVPFVASWMPNARAKTAATPVSVTLNALEAGQQLVVEWRGQPIYILRRTQAMLEGLKQLTPLLADPQSLESRQPDCTRSEHRSLNPEFFVAIGLCTHLGCAPSFCPDASAQNGLEPNWAGGYFCPCHGSRFDCAGRVYKAQPAPLNLSIPPHYYASENVLIIGADAEPQG